MSIVARQDVTVLDCTLRDGGYYTNWEFEDTLVEEYLKACAATGVDVVELGYTQFTPSDRGPYGSFPSGITPALRDALPDGHWLRFAVMVDATALAEVPAPEAGPRLRSLLADGPLPVDLVRVAVHHSRTAGVAEAVDSLRTAGFGVCLNLMQVDLATPAEVADLVRLVAGLGPLESVYVADSLGSLHAPGSPNWSTSSGPARPPPWACTATTTRASRCTTPLPPPRRVPPGWTPPSSAWAGAPATPGPNSSWRRSARTSRRCSRCWTWWPGASNR